MKSYDIKSSCGLNAQSLCLTWRCGQGMYCFCVVVAHCTWICIPPSLVADVFASQNQRSCDLEGMTSWCFLGAPQSVFQAGQQTVPSWTDVVCTPCQPQLHNDSQGGTSLGREQQSAGDWDMTLAMGCCPLVLWEERSCCQVEQHWVQTPHSGNGGGIMEIFISLLLKPARNESKC